MKKKLFNYFLQKALLEEQMLLQLDDKRTALLAVILSSTSVFRRYQSGCTMEAIHFADPKYAEELFLLVCLNAEQHGDHLLKSFNFVPRDQFHQNRRFRDLSDSELSDYLYKEVYPITEAADYTMYATLMGETTDEALKTMSRVPSIYTRAVTKNQLVLPIEGAETKMIDNAWDKLIADEEFMKLLQISAKHDSRGISNAYTQYAPYYEYLLQRC